MFVLATTSGSPGQEVRYRTAIEVHVFTSSCAAWWEPKNDVYSGFDSMFEYREGLGRR